MISQYEENRFCNIFVCFEMWKKAISYYIPLVKVAVFWDGLKKRTRWNIFLKLRRSTRVGVVKKKSFAIIIIIVFSLKNKSTSVNKMDIFYLYKDIVHIFPKLTIFLLDSTRV